MGNVIVKMPTGKIFLVEVYDKDEFSVLYRKIEDLLILNDEIMGGCLEPEEAEKIVVEFFNFIDVVNDYSDFNYNIDYNLGRIFERWEKSHLFLILLVNFFTKKYVLF